MAWIQVTTPDGKAAYLSVDQLVRVRPPVGEVDSQAKAVVDLTAGQQATLESIDEIMQKIKASDA